MGHIINDVPEDISYWLVVREVRVFGHGAGFPEEDIAAGKKVVASKKDTAGKRKKISRTGRPARKKARQAARDSTDSESESDSGSVLLGGKKALAIKLCKVEPELEMMKKQFQNEYRVNHDSVASE
ncbi:hypothetical protein BZA05DRAFT_421440 [Tricharina praecox]|uniref:uncharacterized protein n=1 Tax=Tricharina praecox TaxID=43433 RepID=UPI0022209E06|nr:uncharacterized protein BZA05DRAFT_421440 [Tricharina praecox]KAI5845361.1 hypothetical protein BZA05DRAFT_421440 [Tricharina praecox]